MKTAYYVNVNDCSPEFVMYINEDVDLYKSVVEAIMKINPQYEKVELYGIKTTQQKWEKHPFHKGEVLVQLPYEDEEEFEIYFYQIDYIDLP